jgi:hypothetical protein
MRFTLIVPVAAAALFLASPLSASTAYLRVRPTTVARGGRVTVSGGRCLAGDTVYLISQAFVGNAFVEHSVATTARSNGTFSRVVRIRRRIPPRRYGITARCGGGNLGVVVYLRVTR